MALENLTGPTVYISNLVRTNPAIDDPVSQGDDHLRGVKNVLLNTFPNITGPVTLTQGQLNEVATKYAPLESPAFTGTPTAPTAAAGTDTTQLATTAFVKAAVDSGSVGGAGQSWQNVKASRALGTSYTNSTGRPIMVAVSVDTNTTDNVALSAVIGGVETVRQQQGAGGALRPTASITLIVPNGITYQFNSVDTLLLWSELR